MHRINSQDLPGRDILCINVDGFSGHSREMVATVTAVSADGRRATIERHPDAGTSEIHLTTTPISLLSRPTLPRTEGPIIYATITERLPP